MLARNGIAVSAAPVKTLAPSWLRVKKSRPIHTDQLIVSGSIPSSLANSCNPIWPSKEKEKGISTYGARPRSPALSMSGLSIEDGECRDDGVTSRQVHSNEDQTEAQIVSKSLLSDAAILSHLAARTVVIEPFFMKNLSTSSYDVTLGQYYFREAVPEPGDGIYNPYSKSMVERVWSAQQLQTAEAAGLWMHRTGKHLENISPDDQIIWIRPGETILGHTNEFIGGRDTVTTMMKARSSMGRNFIEVCKCAGWGDIGYVNRWTMEITNNSRNYSIPLVVGRRIAQIVFFDTVGTLKGRAYSDSGKYQTNSDMDKLKQQWSPFDMLPKMYLDREICETKACNDKYERQEA